MALELYLSNRVRRQKQFACYLPFTGAGCPLPPCTATVYEQDRDEHLYLPQGLAYRNCIGDPGAIELPDTGYFGAPALDGVVMQSGAEPNGLVYVHKGYQQVDLIARTDKLGVYGAYNLMLAAYQFVAAQAGALLTHSAAVIYRGEAILFCGVSGDGKSTQAAAWRKYYGAQPLNYDHPCIIWDGDTPIACGTPWGGKESFCENISAPIRAMVFMHKNEHSTVHELRKGEAFSRLVMNNALPHIRPEMDEKLFANVERLVKRVPVYHQEGTLTREAPDTLHRELFGTL